LWNELNWEKRSDAPRREYWTNTLNKPYSYGSGAGRRTYLPGPTHPVIEDCTDALEKELGFRYEACFLNGYETARDALGWHSDDDDGIDHNFPIAVISLYGEGPANGLRSIMVKAINTDDIETFVLNDGSLFLMPAGSQFTHMHKIPKAGHVVRPRISLTYRKLKV
jgi:alkylated DNA repair dioxygenase AlkB